MPRKVTERQLEVLKVVRDFINEHGYPPTLREIGDHFKITSLRGVTVHLDALEKRGYIKRGSGPRTIQILHPAYQPTNKSRLVPILGRIAAGSPATATEDVEGLVPVPSDMVKHIEDAFLLRVKGDSMIGEGIMPRDLVLIKPQQVARNSDLVAVLVDDEATVKRIEFRDKKVRLHPSNPAYEPIEVPGQDVRIIGKVVGLLRDYDGRAF